MSVSNENSLSSSQASDSVVQAARRLREETAPYWVSKQLPWRLPRTPYRVFLAEFLLIRTRANAVAEIFEEVVAAYPDLNSLASADERHLASTLKSLGLKKRVPLLIRAAQYLMEQHEGQVPEKVEDLLEVPGLGLYTSVAIAAFAYDSGEVPADVNIMRFLSRLTGLPMGHPTKGSNDLRALLPLLSQDMGGPEPESLLDFSRTICGPWRPRCSECPIRIDCSYFASTV